MQPTTFDLTTMTTEELRAEIDRRCAQAKIYTVLLIDGEGGWVMGVYSSLAKAKNETDQHETKEWSGGPVTWTVSQNNPDYASGEMPSQPDERYVITSYVVDAPIDK